MKIRKTEIERCAARGDIRAYLNAPYADVQRGFIYASTGHVAARVPITDCGEDVSGHIAPAALQSARKLAGRGKKGDSHATMHANGACTMADGSSMPRPALDPMAIGILDRMDGWCSIDAPADIWLDAELLLDLARAITATSERPQIGITLTRHPDGTIDPAGMIYARAMADQAEPVGFQARGLLMPVRGPK